MSSRGTPPPTGYPASPAETDPRESWRTTSAGSVDSGRSSSLMSSSSYTSPKRHNCGKLNVRDKTVGVDVHTRIDNEMLGAIDTIDIALQTAEDVDYVVDNETKFITTVIINKDDK